MSSDIDLQALEFNSKKRVIAWGRLVQSRYCCFTFDGSACGLLRTLTVCAWHVVLPLLVECVRIPTRWLSSWSAQFMYAAFVLFELGQETDYVFGRFLFFILILGCSWAWCQGSGCPAASSGVLWTYGSLLLFCYSVWVELYEGTSLSLSCSQIQMLRIGCVQETLACFGSALIVVGFLAALVVLAFSLWHVKAFELIYGPQSDYTSLSLRSSQDEGSVSVLFVGHFVTGDGHLWANSR